MPSIADFARRLLEDGQIVHHERPSPVDGSDRELVRVLRRAFDDHALDVAGPAIGFDMASAVAALEVVRQASWFFVSRSEPAEDVERALTMPMKATTAPEHLSADLCLRFLPVLHRRSRSIAPGDRLPALLAKILRDWPLSGVLADLDEGPAELGDLGDHPGLWMLYAERLAKDEKPAWMPSKTGRERVELVFRGLGKERSSLLKVSVASDPEEGV